MENNMVKVLIGKQPAWKREESGRMEKELGG